MLPPDATPTPQAADPATPPAGLAIVLSGGGARAAYQVGLLKGLGRSFPHLRFPIVTGVSAGAINAVYLAAHRQGLEEAARDLSEIWHDLQLEDVFRVDTASMTASFLRWVTRLGSGGSAVAPKVRGLVDTEPLRRLLHRILRTVDDEITGIGHNLDAGLLRALALTTVDYDTGQTVTWVEGTKFEPWERPHRLSRRVRLTIEHVMASAALPLLFPAVRLGPHWHGDGGIRLAAPLAPAIHLGAQRILVVSTRYDRSQDEADRSQLRGYPPPAQILGKLLNSVFLDVIDQDVAQLRHVNQLIARVPPEERGEFRWIETLVLRPSEDLGRLSAGFEPDLPKAFRFLTRSLGTRETSSPDFLSLLMFQPGYLQKLMEIGERDAEARADDVARLLAHSPAS
ncbi:MAG: patatin-like phospholipase family protein [Acidobacteria bacterium]|nr:patatin-like phospholipase family protein [Acidobacteriota bacterium]